MDRWTSAVVGGVAVAALTIGVAAQGRGDVMASLVAAERAFAKASVATSQRDAFLANFADEGVWFTPAPSKTLADLRKQAPPAGPPPRVLDWEPVTGDVAASGDLGYTTGPWIRRERAPDGTPGKTLATGWFFSVWQWRAESGWKVAADFGVEAPHDGELRAQPFQRAQARGAAQKSSKSSESLAADLRAADALLASVVGKSGWADALRGTATADVRTYRNGHAPGVGRDAAARLLPPRPEAFTLAPAFAQVSLAGDLGYTYGSYTSGAGQEAVRGYYLHVWKRQPGGWRLAADVANQEAPAAR
jgi:ketosteroid isomerase-like protein